MAYFFILPAWILVLLVLIAFCVYAKKTAKPQQYAIVINLLIWSTIGFVLANILFWLFLYCLSALGFTNNPVITGIIAILVLVGPVGASIVGFLGGTFYSLWRVNAKSNSH